MEPLERNGFTKDQVRLALHAPWGSQQIEFRYQLLNKNNEPKGWLDVEPGGTLSYGALNEIHRKATLPIRDDSMIEWGVDRVKPICRVYVPPRILDGKPEKGGWAEFPLGVLLLTTPKRQTDASGARIVETECYDQIHILQDPIGGTYRIPKGTNIIQAVSSILTAAGITLQNLAPSDKVMPFDREWDANTTRLQVINDLLKAINYFALYFDAEGYAVARPYTLPAEAPVEYEYRDDAISVIELGSVEEHTDFFDVPNKWVLVVSQPDVGNLRAEYVNDNPNSPTSTVRRGYVRTKYMEVEAADQATLEALARRQAEIDTSIYQHVRWSSWIMPHHGHMDTYYLRSRRDGIEGKFRETSWQMELRPGGRMTHECRRSVQV